MLEKSISWDSPFKRHLLQKSFPFPLLDERHADSNPKLYCSYLLYRELYIPSNTYVCRHMLCTVHVTRMHIAQYTYVGATVWSKERRLPGSTLPGWKDVLILQIFLTDIPRMSEPRVTHDDLVHTRLLTPVVLGSGLTKGGWPIVQWRRQPQCCEFWSGTLYWSDLDPNTVFLLWGTYSTFHNLLKICKSPIVNI